MMGGASTRRCLVAVTHLVLSIYLGVLAPELPTCVYASTSGNASDLMPSLSGNFTIAFRGIGANLGNVQAGISDNQRHGIELEVRASRNAQGMSLSDSDVAQRVNEIVARTLKVRQLSNEQAFTITMSSRDGTLLYKLDSDAQDGVPDGLMSSKLMYDGKTSYLYNVGDARMIISDGLDTSDVTHLPPFVANLSALNLIKSPVLNGDHTISCKVLNSELTSTVYDNASIDSAEVAGQAQMVSATLFGSAHQVLERYTFSGWTPFEGQWIPSKIDQTSYDPITGSPDYSCSYQRSLLISSAIGASEFDLSSILKPGIEVQAKVQGKDVVIPGYRSDISLGDQEQRAYLDAQSKLNDNNDHESSNGGIYLALSIILAILGFTFWKRSKVNAN